MALRKTASLSEIGAGVLGAFLVGAVFTAPCLAADRQIDPRQAGLSWPWLAFGFAAQIAFTARFLVQWIASERARASVIPSSFWLLSLLGGGALFAYFWRRGDPVGMVGQAAGVFVYVRNLALIARHQGEKPKAAGLEPRGLRG